MFEVLLNHQALETLGTTNVIVDEICGEGTWAGYVARCQRWKDSQAKKEALIFEKRRKEKEDRKKKFEEQIEMWKSGKILELYLYYYYLEDDQPNVWLRIKNGIIETSRNIKIGRAEAERLWKLIKFFHNGSKSNTILYWIQPVTNGRSIAIRMIYWLLDVIGSHIARWRVLRDN